jgi:4-alpha-glucanotransferase
VTELSQLTRLASAFGVERAYRDVWSRQVEASPDTHRALLRAMGVQVEDDSQIAAALNDAEERPWREFAPPVALFDEGAEVSIPLAAPTPLSEGRLIWSLAEEGGGGSTGEAAGFEALEERGGRRRGRLTLPIRPSIGYHDLSLELDGSLAASIRLIIAPARCLVPQDVLGEERAWGLAAQLYGVRSRRDWGAGDFSDLAALAELAGREGADFIGVNPLHALFPADARAFAPYRPSSRQSLNVFYVDPEAAPEIDGCPEAHALLATPDMRERLHRAHGGAQVDYAEVWALKLPILERLHHVFRMRPAGGPRRAAFEAFRRARGQALRRQALFDALQERFLREDPANWSWRTWPEPFRRPQSPEVERFARDGAQRVEFFEYLQWLADEQLARAQATAREAGMRIGLFQDLAVGVHPDGASTWAFPEAAPTGASIGAPPDLLNQKGQNWGLVAPSPASLRATGFAPFAETLRELMCHAGAVRIDHTFGLQRMFWIPEGAPAREGAFVRYPFQDMLRIIKLESVRNRCLVVGEDLGTLPEGFQERMERAGVLSYRVLWFEQDEDGFKSTEKWPELALAAVSTHDLPTALGFWTGRDLDWRDRLDLHPDAAAAEKMRADRDRERGMLRRLLGFPAEGDVPPDDFVARLYGYAARAPSRLLAVQLEDGLGEVEAPNLPGTVDEHPNWRRRLPVPVEELFLDPRMRRVVDAVRAARAGRAP